MEKFNEFYNKNKNLLMKIALVHGLEAGDVLGTAWLSWHDASRSYRPDRGAAIETWTIRQFENSCRRERAQVRFGVELDTTDADDDLRRPIPQPSVSDSEAIFKILEPEMEPVLEPPRSGGGLIGDICRAAAAGKSVAEIAARVGRTPRRINQILAKMKMRPDPNPPYQQMSLFDLTL